MLGSPVQIRPAALHFSSVQMRYSSAKWDRSQGRPEPIRALNSIREIENNEPLVDLRSFAPKIKIARETAIPFARETVARMAKRAASLLPRGYHLGLVEAWRPLARQQRIYDFMVRSATEAFPHRDHSAIRRTVCRWVAPTDQKAPPGHCTGAALDVWLMRADGEPADVWSPYEDRFRAAPTFALGLSDEAQHNRTILITAMLEAGFSNCRDEWWHYSYGDAGWAVRTGHPSCFYGLVEMRPDIYAIQEKLSKRGFKDRANPFLQTVK